MNNVDKLDAIYQIFLDAGFTDIELAKGGILEDLLGTANGLSDCYDAVSCVELAVDEARGLLNRLERSVSAAALREASYGSA